MTNLRGVFHYAAHSIGKVCNAVAEAAQFSQLRIRTDACHRVSKSLSPWRQTKHHLSSEIHHDAKQTVSKHLVTTTTTTAAAASGQTSDARPYQRGGLFTGFNVMKWLYPRWHSRRRGYSIQLRLSVCLCSNRKTAWANCGADLSFRRQSQLSRLIFLTYLTVTYTNSSRCIGAVELNRSISQQVSTDLWPLNDPFKTVKVSCIADRFAWVFH